jgi:predicted acylesterase/phospholipase RssA
LRPPCSYFCVTTNLSKGDPAVHRAGPLWLLVRASMTIVGLVPPVFYDGDLLIDGGWATAFLSSLLKKTMVHRCAP